MNQERGWEQRIEMYVRSYLFVVSRNTELTNYIQPIALRTKSKQYKKKNNGNRRIWAEIMKEREKTKRIIKQPGVRFPWREPILFVRQRHIHK